MFTLSAKLVLEAHTKGRWRTEATTIGSHHAGPIVVTMHNLQINLWSGSLVPFPASGTYQRQRCPWGLISASRHVLSPASLYCPYMLRHDIGQSSPVSCRPGSIHSYRASPRSPQVTVLPPCDRLQLSNQSFQSILRCVVPSGSPQGLSLTGPQTSRGRTWHAWHRRN